MFTERSSRKGAGLTATAMHAGIVADIFRLQQTPILPFDDRIALAYPCFQSTAIEHGNVAAAAMDQARLLQLAGGLRDAFAAYTEQSGERLLRDGQLGTGRPIEKRQDRAADLLIHRLEPIARRDLAGPTNLPSPLVVAVDEDHRKVCASAHSVFSGGYASWGRRATHGGMPGAAVGRPGQANLQRWVVKAAAVIPAASP